MVTKQAGIKREERRCTPPFMRWAYLDSNQGPTGYEPAALTTEL